MMERDDRDDMNGSNGYVQLITMDQLAQFIYYYYYYSTWEVNIRQRWAARHYTIALLYKGPQV